MGGSDLGMRLIWMEGSHQSRGCHRQQHELLKSSGLAPSAPPGSLCSLVGWGEGNLGYCTDIRQYRPDFFLCQAVNISPGVSIETPIH